MKKCDEEENEEGCEEISLYLWCYLTTYHSKYKLRFLHTVFYFWKPEEARREFVTQLMAGKNNLNAIINEYQSLFSCSWQQNIAIFLKPPF